MKKGDFLYRNKILKGRNISTISWWELFYVYKVICELFVGKLHKGYDLELRR